MVEWADGYAYFDVNTDVDRDFSNMAKTFSEQHLTHEEKNCCNDEEKKDVLKMNESKLLFYFCLFLFNKEPVSLSGLSKCTHNAK